MTVGPRVASRPPGLGLSGSLLIYGVGAVLLYIATRFLIRLIVLQTGIEPVIAWFIAAGVAVFLPLILIATLMLAIERGRGYQHIVDRLWIRQMSGTDWRWTLTGVAVIALTSTPLVAVLTHLYGKRGFIPPFLAFEPLTSERYWILAVWLPFFALNMLGEAFVWHAVMLPRQVESFGKSAWVVSGAGWMLFHLALPWQRLLSLTPTMFVIPYLVQRRRSIWIGVILHAFVNGPGFIAIAFGFG